MGWSVGDSLGTLDVGEVVGASVGSLVGCRVGASVGWSVVGVKVGCRVGGFVGAKVGWSVVGVVGWSVVGAIVGSPVIPTSVNELVVLPTPNCPNWLSPVHRTRSFWSSTHVALTPPRISTTLDTPWPYTIGTTWLPVLPVPNKPPYWSLPNACTAPFCMRAKELYHPVQADAAPDVIPKTWTGLEE